MDKRFIVLLAVFVLLALIAVYYNQRGSDDNARASYLNGLLGRINSSQVKSGFVTAGGIRTHYLEAGEGETVVLIHGAGEGGITWYPVIGELSKKYRVIVPDVVGYGESDKPDAAYDEEYFSNWLKSFLDAKGIKNADIVGSSQGGATAVHFTLKNKDYVNHLVLVDSAGFGQVPGDTLLLMFLSNTFPSGTFARLGVPYLVYNQSKIDDSWNLYGVEVLRMKGGKNVFWEGRGKIVELISNETLSTIDRKVLVIHGDKDRFFPVEEAYEISNATHARLVIMKNAGHLPFFDDPKEFTDVVIDFLQN